MAFTLKQSLIESYPFKMYRDPLETSIVSQATYKIASTPSTLWLKSGWNPKMLELKRTLGVAWYSSFT